MSKVAEEHLDYWIMNDYSYNKFMVEDWKLVRKELKDLRAKVEMQNTSDNSARAEICPSCDGVGTYWQYGEVIKCSRCNGTGKLSPIA